MTLVPLKAAKEHCFSVLQMQPRVRTRTRLGLDAIASRLHDDVSSCKLRGNYAPGNIVSE